MVLLTLVLCLLGFGALALSTDRAQDTLFGRESPVAVSRRYRIAWWVALVLALWGLVHDKGWSLGLVTYSGQTTFAAAVVYLALIAYARRAGR